MNTTYEPLNPPRRVRAPFLAVIAASLVSALLASVVTVALLGPHGGTSTTGTTSASSATEAGAASAQASTPSTVTVESSNAIVEVAAKVSPSVVTITTSSASSSFGAFQIPTSGVGSGVIFDSSGLILTNWHVVEGGGQLTVSLKDGTDLTGRVVASDPDRDLAVVKVDAASALPAAEIGSSNGLQVGQLVVAIGSPLGTFTDSVTSGIVSAMNRSITVRDATTRQARHVTGLIQTDAAINEGNSGGPLLDASGRVIGINTATASTAEGIGFAIPIDEAQSILQTARTNPAGTP